MEKIEIKECKEFGTSGSHIVMAKEDAGKKFLVLPENSKYILIEILKKYHDVLEELTNPSLSEFLTKTEFDLLKKIYEKEIKNVKGGYIGSLRKTFMESTYDGLKNNKLRVNDIDAIFNEIESSIPKSLKDKLKRELFNKN